MKLIEAYEIVIADIDKDMEDAPSRELADLSNALEARKAKVSNE